MRIFKNRAFNKWAAREGLSDATLRRAVQELEQGLLDADLGGSVVKKRVPLAGRGKRGGARTLVVYRTGSRAVFVYGFAKNVRSAIRVDELNALRRYGFELLGYDDRALRLALGAGELIEVDGNGNG